MLDIFYLFTCFYMYFLSKKNFFLHFFCINAYHADNLLVSKVTLEPHLIDVIKAFYQVSLNLTWISTLTQHIQQLFISQKVQPWKYLSFGLQILL